mmetsp:Transcript_52428/g.170201  ORF Transcript_52428/g.170201 Transcript_52428/m.170201 type:complete len:349 (+) Transcript_52428:1391-2437(+)
MQIWPMHLDFRSVRRSRQLVAVGTRVELVNAGCPAPGRARRPDRTGLVLLNDDRHHERGIDFRVRAHLNLALVASIPDHNGRMGREPANLVPQLRILHGRGRGRMARLRVLHVMVHDDAQLVTSLVPLIEQEHAASPDAQGVHASVDRGLHQDPVRLAVQPALELLHRDHIRALGPHHGTIDPEVHAVRRGTLLAPGVLHILGIGVVACDEREVAETNPALRRHRLAGVRGESDVQFVQLLLAHACGPPQLDLRRGDLEAEGLHGLARGNCHLGGALRHRVQLEAQLADRGGGRGEEDADVHLETAMSSINQRLNRVFALVADLRDDVRDGRACRGCGHHVHMLPNPF